METPSVDDTAIPDMQPSGALDVTGHILHSLGVNALSGIKGLSDLLPGGSGDPSKAISDYQEKYGPHDLSPAGQETIRNTVAPVYRGIQDTFHTKDIGDAYGAGAQQFSDLAGKYLGPEAAGVAGSIADTAPMMVTPEGLLGKSVAGAAEREIPKMLTQDPKLLTAPEAPSHAVSISSAKDVGHPEYGLMGYHPNASVVDVRHPETGELTGRMVMEPNGNMMQGRTADIYDEGDRGKGLGTKMLQTGVEHAHSLGMDWGSDVKISPSQTAVYMKLQEKGYPIQFNPTSSITEDKYLTSGDGKPVITIPRPEQSAFTEPMSASVVPHEHGHGVMVNGRVVSTHGDLAGAQDAANAVNTGSFAEGGEVGPVLGDLASMIKQYAPLKGMPRKATVPGMNALDVGPHRPARDAAAAYMKEAGLPYHPPSQYAQVDPQRAARIATAFDQMPHAPDDPAVKASYDAMIKETNAQYQHMKKAGVNVEFIKPGEDPYAASPRLAAEDVKQNNHLWVFPTDAGFGGADDAAATSGNPLLGNSGETFGGQPATNNDVFRAVHDYFGHVKEGVGFRANGEENAWRQHAGMYSDAARPAMTAETRGQNSWLNYGPHGEANRTAPSDKTIFAPQKTGLLPDEFNQLDDPEMHFLHMSNLNTPEATLDPKFYGTGLKGAEARRGGTKVTSLYPSDIDAKDIETGLQQKTPYRVSVPKSSMYDLSTDSEGHLSNMPDFSAVEDAIKDKGYAGYHVPDAQGVLRGQGRLFGPTPATRLGPGGASPGAEEDLSQGFAEGGEVAPVLGDLGSLVAKYAPEAGTLADRVADTGGVTYNPTSGEIHSAGYAVPTHPHRSMALDAAPTPDQLHDYLVQHQDAFDEDPQAALHVHSDEDGNHYVHVAHVTPDFGAASDVAAQHGLPGFQDLAGGDIFPANHGEATADVPTSTESPDQDLVEKYLAPSHVSTPWTPGQQTVSNPQRNAFPGIYNDPRQVISDAAAKVGPEDPLLQRLFGVSRQDLSDTALGRTGNELGRLPGAKPNPTGSAAVRNVMTPANAQRIVDTLTEARNSPELYKGMTGWYAMDPLYERFRQIFGEDEAPARYAHFNTLMGMASPGSDVGTEIARGTSAHWLNNEGRFNDFVKYAGGMGRDAPADMADVPGHVYHATAHSVPMDRYLQTGSIQMKSPKVPPYIQASGVPETGFQTDLPVGDAHFSRGVGLADVRGGRTNKGVPTVPQGSVTTPEMQMLHPWWRDRVAAQAGLESVPAQALMWGAYSPYTGVESAIGAPKLEILSTQIGKLATRLGVSPETARDLVITGKAGAYRFGGSVG